MLTGLLVKVRSSAVALSVPSQDSGVPRVFATERGKVYQVHRSLFFFEGHRLEVGSAEVDLFYHQFRLELFLGHLGLYPLSTAQHAFREGQVLSFGVA